MLSLRRVIVGVPVSLPPPFSPPSGCRPFLPPPPAREKKERCLDVTRARARAPLERRMLFPFVSPARTRGGANATRRERTKSEVLPFFFFFSGRERESRVATLTRLFRNFASANLYSVQHFTRNHSSRTILRPNDYFHRHSLIFGSGVSRPSEKRRQSGRERTAILIFRAFESAQNAVS